MDIEPKHFLVGLILFTVVARIILEKLSPKPKEKLRTVVVREIIKEVVRDSCNEPQLCVGCRKLLR